MNDPSFRIVVIDNGSSDDSWNRIKRWASGDESVASRQVAYRRDRQPLKVVSYDKAQAEAGGTATGEAAMLDAPPHRALTLVRSVENRGFAGGCNIGIRFALKCGAEYVWLLNNDTIVHPNALSEMVALASSNNMGLVGSVLSYLHDQKSIQAFGGGSINWWLGTSRYSKEPGKEKLDFLTGASLLIKRQVVESVGLLDDSYFFYWEDIDYSRRALEAGWRIGVAGGSRVLHKEGGTVSGGGRTKTLASDRFMVRSMVLFFRAHGGLRWPLVVLLRLSGVVVNRLLRGQLDRVVPLLKVAWCACRESISSTPNGPTLAK